jgi:hypothetical protein
MLKKGCDNSVTPFLCNGLFLKFESQNFSYEGNPNGGLEVPIR